MVTNEQGDFLSRESRTSGARRRISRSDSHSSADDGNRSRGRIKRALSTSAATGVGAIIGLAAVVGVSSVASAEAAPDVPPNLVSQADVSEKWAETVRSSELVLPVGVTLPDTPPWIFSTDDAAADTYYEATMFDQVALQYSRCAWLKEELGSIPAGQLRAPADDGVYAEVEASFEEALPATSQSEYQEYQQVLTDEAAQLGVSSAELEYADNCMLYTGEAN
ncbi:hypothetical protein LQ938_15145 [Microbacterium sp. cx-55]|uniref:hypothetical protein n=1 Tax=unclassified Microbacterium TaxID=2609290 RepID=UPI001CBCEE79|nr:MULTISPECIES: hypothetical protein [unclassified Microbacterium]MBZ4487136.1 hypothetical protein [Microbacterium sp. cx-55]MCC4908738.1 hypothetical protein [Microbacterium sp. cx-59]UGB35170.1 hypothetical protein LQ938_15145 [Microbacterium sp. cx-55]